MERGVYAKYYSIAFVILLGIAGGLALELYNAASGLLVLVL